MYEKYISCEPDILGDYDTDTAMVQEENDEDDDEPDDAMDDGKKIIFIFWTRNGYRVHFNHKVKFESPLEWWQISFLCYQL